MNQRQSERVTINKDFESLDSFIEEYVMNLSKGGVFVRSKSPLPVGSTVNLQIRVFLDDFETIEGVGEVVRVQESPSGMAVVFRELSQYSKKLVDRLLTQPPGS